MQRTNRLREILAAGKIAVGTCLDSYSPAAVEAAGYSGLDFCRIDNEYSWRRDDSMEHMMRAAAVAGITAMVRVEKGNHYLISKALQIGAGAILVSDIVSVQEAVDVVKAAKFPPRGGRGYSSYSFSGRWGLESGEDWTDWCDTQLMVGVMIENEQVVGRIDEVMAIDGLDYVLFGPADYSMSIGLRSAKKNHPKVQAAIERTVEAAARHGKPVAIGIGQPFEAEARTYLDLGCRIIEAGHELGILRSIYTAAATSIRALRP